MRVFARLVTRLALSRDPAQRWRQLSVAASSLVAAWCVLAAVALTGASHDVAGASASRFPIAASAPDEDALHVSTRGFTIDGRQASILWLEPAPGHEHDPAIVPPGLRALPAPGEAVVSPGLVRLGVTARSLGAAPSTAGLGEGGAIGPAGIGTQDELFAYVRPAPGRTLGSGGALLTFARFPAAGEVDPSRPNPLAVEDAVPRGPLMAALVLGFLVVPAGAALVLGVRAQSPVRRARSELLLRIGVDPRFVRLLLGAEGAVLAAVGAVAALVAFQLVAPHVAVVPLTGTVLVPGTLQVPPVQAALAVLGVVAAAGTVSAGGALVASTRTRSTRPPGVGGLAPLLGGLVVLLVGVPVVHALGVEPAPVVLGGALLLLVGMPVAAPALSRLVATRVTGTTDDSHLWLAAARVAHAPRRASRVAALLVAVTYLSAVSVAVHVGPLGGTQEVRSSATSAVGVFSADWRDARPGDVDDLRAAFAEVGGTTVLPLLTSEDPDDPAPRVAVTSCDDVAAFARAAGSPTCADGRLDTEGLAPLADLLGVHLVVEPVAADAPDAVLFLSDHPVDTLTVHRAGAFLPAFNPHDVLSLSGGSTVLSGWVAAGWAVAVVVLGLAVLRELVEHAIGAVREDAVLLRAGLDDDDALKVTRWTLLLPVLATAPAAYVGGLVVSLVGTGPGLTAYAPGWISLVTVVTLALSGAAVVLATSRPALRRPARRSASRARDADDAHVTPFAEEPARV